MLTVWKQGKPYYFIMSGEKENNGCAYIFLIGFGFLVINGFLTCMGNSSAKYVSYKIDQATPYFLGGFILLGIIMWIIMKIINNK